MGVDVCVSVGGGGGVVCLAVAMQQRGAESSKLSPALI